MNLHFVLVKSVCKSVFRHVLYVIVEALLLAFLYWLVKADAGIQQFKTVFVWCFSIGGLLTCIYHGIIYFSVLRSRNDYAEKWQQPKDTILKAMLVHDLLIEPNKDSWTKNDFERWFGFKEDVNDLAGRMTQ